MPTRGVLVACALGLSGSMVGSGLAVGSARAHSHGRAHTATWTPPAGPGYAATLEQCSSSASAAARTVTFTGEMVATAATQRMSMRIELIQHVHGESGYHTIVAPGLGVWRSSEAGVKIYRYVKQITNLSAPAVYRAIVHFRWFGDKSRVIKRAELRTARCAQPLLAAPETPPASPASPAPAA